MGLLWILVSECVKLLFTRNYVNFETSIWKRSMQENIVIIKLFQACAVRYAGRPLEDLTEHIPYTNKEVDLPMIPGVDVQNLLGSGVVALTYDATYKGEKLVIKVKRRGIETRIKRDVNAARWWIRILTWFPSIQILNLNDAFAEVQDMLHTQLDFRQEVRSQKEYRAMLSHPNIVIPELFEELCTETVIVMRKLDGERLSSIPFEAREPYATWVAHAIITSVMHGLIHADMHVGNVVFMKNSIGIIDFGLMIRLNASDHVAYLSVLQYIIAKNYPEVAESLLDNFIHPTKSVEQLDPEARTTIVTVLSATATRLLSAHSTVTVSDILQIGKAVLPYGLYITPTIYRLVVSMAANELLINNLTTSSTALLFGQGKARLL